MDFLKYWTLIKRDLKVISIKGKRIKKTAFYQGGMVA